MRTFALALSLLAITPATAAADHDVPIPAGAPTVAGPTPSGARVVGFERGAEICTSLVTPGHEDGVDGVDGDNAGCSKYERPSLWTESFSGGGGDTKSEWSYGDVPPQVAEVEAVYSDGTRVRTATGALPEGSRFAGRLRFYLVERASRIQSGREQSRLRLFDAAGTLLAVRELDGPSRATLGPYDSLASGRSGGRRWDLVTSRQRRFSPTPLDFERETTLGCIGVARKGDDRRMARVCVATDLAAPPLAVGQGGNCRDGLGGVLTILASARVATVTATLGDGSTRAIALRPTPPQLGNRRAGVLVVGARVAVREVVARDAAGKLIVRDPVSLAPGTSRCAERGAGFSSFFAGAGLIERVPGSGTQLLTRDEGPYLCVALGAFDIDGGDCGLPPLEGYSSHIQTRQTVTETVIAGAVPADTATVRLHLDDGSRPTVAATEDGYDGRYRGKVRFFTFAVPGKRSASFVDLFDSAGERSGVAFAGGTLAFSEPPRRLVSDPSGFAAFGAARTVFGDRVPCLGVAYRSPPDEDQCEVGPSPMVAVNVSCNPRRTVLHSRVSRRTRSFEARLAGGRTVRARLSPFSKRLGGRAALLVLGPRDELRDLRLRGPVPARVPFTLPPAAEQCGYETFVFLR